VSIYAINSFCRRIVHDAALRRALEDSPEQVLRSMRPALSEEEIALLTAGDVGHLSRMGANNFLLHQLGRWELFGLDLASYGERIRTAWRQERESTETPVGPDSAH
jgi:hypothetical protein